MRLIVVLPTAFLVSATACACSSESAGSVDVPEAVTTTIAIDPPSAASADKSVLPTLEDPGRFDRGRARIRAIEGFETDDAKAWAVDSGWLEILVIDIDIPDVEGRPADYWPFVLGLYERDGVVVEAWVGG